MIKICIGIVVCLMIMAFKMGYGGFRYGKESQPKDNTQK